MKSLLQFFLLIALVLIGKQVKQQTHAVQATAQPAVRQHTESIQSFFVQHVSYKNTASQEAVGVEYGRKTNPVSLN